MPLTPVCSPLHAPHAQLGAALPSLFRHKTCQCQPASAWCVPSADSTCLPTVCYFKRSFQVRGGGVCDTRMSIP